MKTGFRVLITLLATLVILPICETGTAMSRTPEVMGRDEYLDRYFPFIEQGQEPPGRFVPNEQLGGTPTWQGQMEWRTRHGPAVLFWSLGKPHNAENALYPDGRRGDVGFTLDYGFRRSGGAEIRWIYGKIEVSSNDVLFVDGDQPHYQPPPQGEIPDLEADLGRDSAFMADLKDSRFSSAVLTVFSNRNFYKGQDPRVWICGLRQAARMSRI